MSKLKLPIIETYLDGMAPYGKPGDIILLTPEPFSKNASITVQRLLRVGRRINHSHVAVALNDCNAIHSTPVRGVHVVPIRELASESMIRCGRVSIFRHPVLEQDDEIGRRVQESLWKHFNQPYFHVLKRIGNKSSYCSELAAKAFEEAGIRITRRNPRRTLPVDIEKAVLENGWSDVSVQYLLPIVEPDISSLVSDRGPTAAGMRVMVAEIHRQQDEMNAMLVRAEESLARLKKQALRRRRLRRIKALFGLSPHSE